MLRQDAIEEVRALLALNLDPTLPAMRAHGVPELAGYLRGELTLAEPARRIELVTGQYTKRQATWFRHHPLADPRARIRSMRDSPDWSNFRKETPRVSWHLLKAWVDAPHHPAYRCAPPSSREHRLCRQRHPVGSRSPSPRPEGPGRRGHLRISRRRGAADLRRAVPAERHPPHPGPQEGGAVHAAEGYARSHRQGRRGAGESGPGATNAVTGLTDALMDQSRSCASPARCRRT